jgi:hypothetical protein
VSTFLANTKPQFSFRGRITSTSIRKSTTWNSRRRHNSTGFTTPQETSKRAPPRTVWRRSFTESVFLMEESRLIADLRVSQNSRQCNFSTQILSRFERDAHARLCSLAQGSTCVQIAVDRPRLSFATDAPGLATRLTGTVESRFA